MQFESEVGGKYHNTLELSYRNVECDLFHHLFNKNHFYLVYLLVIRMMPWKEKFLIQDSLSSHLSEKWLHILGEVWKQVMSSPDTFCLLWKWSFMMLSLWFSIWHWLRSADIFGSTLDWKDVLMGHAYQSNVNQAAVCQFDFWDTLKIPVGQIINNSVPFLYFGWRMCRKNWNHLSLTALNTFSHNSEISVDNKIHVFYLKNAIFLSFLVDLELSTT